MDKIDKKFLQKLEDRFKANMHRHKHIKWDFVQSSLMTNDKLYDAVLKMEETGGEPDLIDLEVFRGTCLCGYVKRKSRKPTQPLL